MEEGKLRTLLESQTVSMIKNIFKIILLISFLCNCCLAFADQTINNKKPTLMLSLNDAVLLALRFNPSVQSGEIQRIVDKWSLAAAQYQFQWQFSLSGQAQYNYFKTGGVSTDSKTNFLSPTANLTTALGTQISVQPNFEKDDNFNPGVNVSITQPLMSGFGPAVTLAPLNNAYDQEVINKLTLKNNVMQTITSVISAYRALVAAKENLITAQLVLKGNQDVVTQNQALIQAGRMAPSDIVQAQAQVANQQVSVQEALNGVVQASQQLLVLLGMDPNIPIDVPTDIQISPTNIPDQQKSIDLALQNDPTYQSELYNIKILKRNLLVAEDQNRWTLNLVANSSVGNGTGGGPNAGINSLVNGQNLANTVGLQLNVPIDNVSLQQAVVNARVGLEQGQIQLEATKRQVVSNVISAIENIAITVQQAQQAEQALSLSKQTLDIANAKQKYGKSSTFEVVSDARDYNNALLQETSSKITYLNAITAYDQVVGTTLDTWHINIRY